MDPRRFRGTSWLIVAAAAVATLQWLGAPAAGATPAEDARLLALLNSVRSEAGLPPVIADASLASVASGWAASMASAGALSHNGSLTSSLTGWSKLGENVGRGATIEVVHGILVASPAHRAVMVDPAFTRVGFGVVHAADGRVYVVADFMQPASAAAPRPAQAVAAAAPGPTAASAAATPAPASASAASAAPPSTPAAASAEDAIASTTTGLGAVAGRTPASASASGQDWTPSALRAIRLVVRALAA